MTSLLQEKPAIYCEIKPVNPHSNLTLLAVMGTCLTPRIHSCNISTSFQPAGPQTLLLLIFPFVSRLVNWCVGISFVG